MNVALLVNDQEPVLVIGFRMYLTYRIELQRQVDLVHAPIVLSGYLLHVELPLLHLYYQRQFQVGYAARRHVKRLDYRPGQFLHNLLDIEVKD